VIYKTAVTFLLCFAFEACSNKATKQSSNELPNDSVQTPTAVVTEPVREVADEIPDSPYPNDLAEFDLSLEAKNLVGLWTSPGAHLLQNFIFYPDNKLLMTSAIPGATRESGTWRLSLDTLILNRPEDTIIYRVSKFTSTVMEMESLNHKDYNIFGQKSDGNDGKRYNSVLRDKICSPLSQHDLLGAWAMGDAFTFKENSLFKYFDPNCYQDVPGTWTLNEVSLVLAFAGNGCPNSNYEREYEVVKITHHWLVLKDSKGDVSARIKN
jgi:hypothetical protein